MQCKKCGNKKAKELYYQVKYEGHFFMSMDEKGNEEIDWGGYTFLEDFIENMLQESERKLTGCNTCVSKKQGEKAAIKERVKQIISDVLEVEVEEVTVNTSLADDLGADSLDVTELIMALEEEFNIEIPDEDVEKITEVREVVDYIQKRCKKK